MGTDAAQDHAIVFYEIQAGLKRFRHILHQRGLQDCSDFLNQHSFTSLMLSEKALFGKLSARNLSVQKNDLGLLSIGCQEETTCKQWAKRWGEAQPLFKCWQKKFVFWLKHIYGESMWSFQQLKKKIQKCMGLKEELWQSTCAFAVVDGCHIAVKCPLEGQKPALCHIKFQNIRDF